VKANKFFISNSIACIAKYISLSALFVCILYVTQAQTCPPNIDFERGDFAGWTCHTGNVLNVGGTNQINLSPSGPVSNRHQIFSSASGNERDEFGGFPTVCPNGSGYSIKLGNTSGGAEAEGVSYEFTIPANRNEYNLIYHYAVVFQDPNHQGYEQPRMQIEITNVTDGNTIDCSSFDFIPIGSGLPGFQQSSTPGGNTPVWYKDWSAVSINLDGNAGKTIRLFFKTADCVFRRHFGYAYIDVNTECSSKLEGASFCPDDASVNVVAPYGYQKYSWYNSNFTQFLGSQQTLTIAPAPTSGMTVAVIVEPFNGYGCIDTLFAELKNDLVVTANAGKDTTSCNKSPVQLGGPPLVGVKYEWSPQSGLSNPFSSNPFAVPDVTTTYVVSASSKGGGCVTTDTVIVKASLVNNAVKLEGKNEFCTGFGDSAVLVVEQADSIQWFKDNVVISGANASRYKVLQSGTYYAILFGGNNCQLTTAPTIVRIASVPNAALAITSPNSQCLFGNKINIANNSTNALGGMNYAWQMGDGTVLNTKDVSHSYTKGGTYKVRLIVSSLAACADSIDALVTIYPNAAAAFTVQPTCVNLPVLITNNTVDTLGSPINYLWTFGNGQTSTLKNPPAQVYTQAGNYQLSLSVSSVQCPNPVHTVRQTLTIDRPKPGIAYPEKFAVINLPLDLSARNFGGSVLWQPANNLDKAASYTPVFKSNVEQLLTVNITTKSGCVTTDTQMVKLVKSIEIYVPNAFTPDGDGKNDVLRPVMFGIKKLNYFRVYSRWDGMYYQTSEIGKGWDGVFRGRKQEMQTVVWQAEGVGVDGKIYHKSGTTVLIR
jgi:gliding motility-associated-like protein